MKHREFYLGLVTALAACSADEDPMQSTGTSNTSTSDGPTSGGASESGLDTEADPECAMAGSNPDSPFSIDHGEWPVNNSSPNIDIDASCTIDAITVPDEVQLSLTCDADDGDLPLTVGFGMPAAGTPSWEVGSAVSVQYRWIQDDLLGVYSRLVIRDTDGRLLLAGADTGGFEANELNVLPVDIAPIIPTPEDGICPGFGAPMRVAFALDGEEVDIMSGNIEVLPQAGTDDVYSIDLLSALDYGSEPGDGPRHMIRLLVVSVAP